MNFIGSSSTARGENNIKLIDEALANFPMLGYILKRDEVVEADREGRRPFENIADAPPELFAIASQSRQVAGKHRKKCRCPV